MQQKNRTYFLRGNLFHNYFLKCLLYLITSEKLNYTSLFLVIEDYICFFFFSELKTINSLTVNLLTWISDKDLG